MRIAISAEDERGLDSTISHHFGRCPFFVLVDLEDTQIKEAQAIPNPFYAAHQPGQVPAFINSQEADVMLAGGMGAKAISFFEQHGIRTVTGAQGTVRSALEDYLGGGLQDAAPCHESVEHGCD
jgi:predicted Fe-Mo cluster-binding NifX family protein